MALGRAIKSRMNNVINSLLRSGCPDNFLSLGENGQAVFDSALQIRETLRLRKQQAAADTLAIPQSNESGSRIDWYAPVPGKITSWAAASEDQRSAALHYLEHCLTSVNLLGLQCQRSEKTALRLFGSLLGNAFQFPGSQYIYLVGDKPVITFWGFINQNEHPKGDVLDCLKVREPRETTTPLTPAPAEPVQVKEITREPSMISEEAGVVASPRPRINVQKSRGKLSAAVAFVVLVILVGSGYVYTQHRTSETLTEMPDVAVSAQPLIQTNVPASALPLMLAEVIPPVADVPEPASPPVTPPVKGALVIPPEQLKTGSTKFLNGTWQARVQFSSPIAGKPPALRYRIINNKGTVRLFNSDNVLCKADVFSGLQQSGTLMIKSRGNARCDDGSRHVLPEISCKSGSNGLAECTGRFEGDNLAQVTFQKVSN